MTDGKKPKKPRKPRKGDKPAAANAGGAAPAPTDPTPAPTLEAKPEPAPAPAVEPEPALEANRAPAPASEPVVIPPVESERVVAPAPESRPADEPQETALSAALSPPSTLSPLAPLSPLAGPTAVLSTPLSSPLTQPLTQPLSAPLASPLTTLTPSISVAASEPVPPPPSEPQPAAALAPEIDRRVTDRRAQPYSDPDAASLPEPDALSTAGVLAAGGPPPGPDMSMLDPAAAAFEAARIAGEIVGDIQSASGAAIVAAAAAGAAIEAARARRAAGAPSVIAGGAGGAEAEANVESMVAAQGSQSGVQSSAQGGTMPISTTGLTGDPTQTVRMHRERILRALADDIASNAAITDQDPSEPSTAHAHHRAGSQPGRAPSQPGIRSDAEDGADDDAADPVQIAAAAIQRLRHRASTDFAGLRVHYNRHDIVVIVAAFLIIVVAGRVHHALVTPPNKRFEQRGLVFEHSQAWLKVEDLPEPPPRIARDPTGQPPKADNAYHVAYTSSVDPSARIEVLIDKKPAWSNYVTGLELDRRTRWGELYTLDDSAVLEIEDQNWLRTVYRYAHASEKGDVPRVDHAVEYATVDREQIYVITLFGTESELERIESVVAPTLRVPTRSGLPLVPQTRSGARRNYPNPVARAFDSTVMIVVADLIDGKLRARGGGSGVIVGADGSILTNYHVIHDKNGRLHDVFVIGRFSTLDHAPQLQCAGRPNRSKLQRELDLALIKCDTDLDGRTWIPASSGVWATLPEAKSSDIAMGQRLWVLGYPDVGGGGLTLSEGEIGGWTGQDGAAGKDFIKTDASITHGNSGGPVVDDQGRLVGIASASRTKISSTTGTVIETSQVGLVRPLATASDLLAIAATGWTPREGHTDVELQPSAVEAPAEGIRIATKVIDAANESPVRDALVMVLRPGVNASTIDVNALDDQVLSWGRSNTQGEVQLKQPVPVPGTYTVMVVARGYEPLIGEDKLRLDDKTPAAFDPWGEIKLLSR